MTALAAAAFRHHGGASLNRRHGVAVRLKRPLIASLISGYLWRGGRYCGACQPPMAAPGVFYQRAVFDPANPMTIVWVFGVMALAVVLSFVLTLILGFEDIPVEDEVEKPAPCRARRCRPNRTSLTV